MLIFSVNVQFPTQRPRNREQIINICLQLQILQIDIIRFCNANISIVNTANFHSIKAVFVENFHFSDLPFVLYLIFVNVTAVPV